MKISASAGNLPKTVDARDRVLHLNMTADSDHLLEQELLARINRAIQNTPNSLMGWLRNYQVNDTLAPRKQTGGDARIPLASERRPTRTVLSFEDEEHELKPVKPAKKPKPAKTERLSPTQRLTRDAADIGLIVEKRGREFRVTNNDTGETAIYSTIKQAMELMSSDLLHNGR